MANTELRRFTDLLGNMAEESRKEECRSFKRLKVEGERFQAQWKINPGPLTQLDPLMVFLLEFWEEELVKDAKKRALRPDVKWGPSLLEQFTQARKDKRYRENLQTIMKSYGSKLTMKQKRVIAFIRTDRQYTEQLGQEAENDGQILAEGFSVATVACLLADNIDMNRFLYRMAKRRRRMVQYRHNPACYQIMRKPGEDSFGGA